MLPLLASLMSFRLCPCSGSNYLRRVAASSQQSFHCCARHLELMLAIRTYRRIRCPYPTNTAELALVHHWPTTDMKWYQAFVVISQSVFIFHFTHILQHFWYNKSRRCNLPKLRIIMVSLSNITISHSCRLVSMLADIVLDRLIRILGSGNIESLNKYLSHFWLQIIVSRIK
jgi:hypothetical protein